MSKTSLRHQYVSVIKVNPNIKENKYIDLSKVYLEKSTWDYVQTFESYLDNYKQEAERITQNLKTSSHQFNVNSWKLRTIDSI